LSPEIEDNSGQRIIRPKPEKADAVGKAEGSSPGGGMVSFQDTTGVVEQGMCSKGQLGNLGEPSVSPRERQKMKGTG
jgi:hypothetical protein